MWLISVFLCISGATCWWSEMLHWMAGCWDASATWLHWRWSEFNVTICMSSWDDAHQRIIATWIIITTNSLELNYTTLSEAVQLSCVWIIASSVQVCYHPRQCGEDWWRQQFEAWCPVVADGVIWHFLHLKHSFWQCKDIETLPLCLTGLWWENTGDNQWGFQFVSWFTRIKSSQADLFTRFLLYEAMSI